ncbi:MAG TPA: SAM-dependent methyltransferase [Candidatus Tumulicola sp.]|nr:SAM-dependent methyltransferase [Candidatus Tumulicola sp.]
MPGSLTCVGVGIQFGAHASMGARRSIAAADKVLHLAGDQATAAWIDELNPAAESLHGLYALDKPRIDIYNEMVERIMNFVRAGMDVCVVTYGHPGIFAYPTHEAMRLARGEGFPATMLPAISAIDCLYADLGIDPGTNGCQCYEATDFLARRRVFDPCTALVLLQIGLTGDFTHQDVYALKGYQVLLEVLEATYGPDHEIVIYEAARFPVCDAVIQRLPLSKASRARILATSTMFVPPKGPAPLDDAMLERLGLSAESRAQK